MEANTTEYFRPRGILVLKIYLVTAPRYPRSVTDAIEEKIKATQRAIQRENELRETEAAAKTLLQAMWIEKWDGQLPEVMPGNSNLLMSLSAPAGS